MTGTPNQAPLRGSGIIQLFDSLAESSWDRLGYARRLQIGLSEDTISDLNALEIARHYPREITVKRVSRQLEGFVGFDWAWVFHRPNMLPVVYVVQAKKVRIDNSGRYVYPKLRHGNRSGYQINALQEFADWIGATPLYCFYNNVAHQTASARWHCQQQPQPDPRQMGCTLVPLASVRPIHDGSGPRDFDSLHRPKVALPWRCIFHPGCTTSGVYSIGPQPSDNQRGRLVNLSELLSRDEDVIDEDSVIPQLDLDELIDSIHRAEISSPTG